ncbi:serine hydrolase FSH [Aspergillus alliaceus]|uniref:Serine hydrolase FSH n=1 Tax=Petromyces alliaceus TaxID=209559 RepID=A0A5N6FFS0_PETAA|nr:serine hydrolase FSH [Aspergillus alliaceus]KAB8227474.1 serine hydrolase FSH [Aspergillus alliaceus]KAE8386671.1 serine hydrolase FSH [Aspergillus alliaceus]
MGPKIRILCLHGKGTSALVFRSQTTSFRTRLNDLPLEFDFIDAPHPTTPAAGIDLFYDPPYYAFWPDDTLSNVHSARKWLLDHIATHGPYDAVMGFSQGSILAASTLLWHAYESPGTPPPFKAAIFICGGAPLGVLEEVGYEIPPEVREWDLESRRRLAAVADKKAILAAGSARWKEEEIDVEGVRGSLVGEVKIQVPTVHVYGSRDPRYGAGVLLSGVCEERKRRDFNHGGGHDIPRGQVVSDKLAELVRWALREGRVC